MSIHGPYRDQPEEKDLITAKWPVVKISTPDRRLVQVSDRLYIVEKLVETKDALGAKSLRWEYIHKIAPPSARLSYLGVAMQDFEEEATIPVSIVLWILRNT